MIRVYLDWNIITNLKKHSSNSSEYHLLNELINNNKDKVIVPYSAAHLADLLTSFRSSHLGETETVKDLLFLNELSGGLCLIYNHQTKIVEPKVHDAKEFFKEIEPLEVLTPDRFKSLYPNIDCSAFDELGAAIMKYLESAPEYQVLSKAFSGKVSEVGVMGLVELMNKYNADHSVYRGLRNSSLSQLNLNLDYTRDDDPISKISHNLLLSTFRMTFDEFCQWALSFYHKDVVPGRLDLFVNYYMMLDFFGYYRDKKFKNLVNDAYHAFYASHCDIFVTNDDNAYHKAKTLYKYLNIETQVCKISEFNSVFHKEVERNTYNGLRILQTIKTVIRDNCLQTTLMDEESNPVDVYRPQFKILHHFDRVQVRRSVDSYSVSVYRKVSNYSDFLFFIEIKCIVNLLVAEFGQDQNNYSVFISEVENDEILQNQWRGRIWKLGKWIAGLRIIDQPYGIVLQLDYLR